MNHYIKIVIDIVIIVTGQATQQGHEHIKRINKKNSCLKLP